MADTNKTQTIVLIRISAEQFYTSRLTDRSLEHHHLPGNRYLEDLIQFRKKNIPKEIPVYWSLPDYSLSDISEGNKLRLKDTFKDFPDMLMGAVNKGLPLHLFTQKEINTGLSKMEQEERENLCHHWTLNYPDFFRCTAYNGTLTLYNEVALTAFGRNFYNLPVITNSLKCSTKGTYKIKKLIKEKRSFIFEFDPNILLMNEKETEKFKLWLEQKSLNILNFQKKANFLPDLLRDQQLLSQQKLDGLFGTFYNRRIDSLHYDHRLSIVLDGKERYNPPQEPENAAREGTLFSDMNGQVLLAEGDLSVEIDKGRIRKVNYRNHSFIKGTTEPAALSIGAGKKELVHTFTNQGAFAFESEYVRGLRESLILENENFEKPAKVTNDYLYAGDYPYLIVNTFIDFPKFRNERTIHSFTPLELPIHPLNEQDLFAVEGGYSWNETYKYQIPHESGSRLFPGNQFLLHLPEGTVHLKLIMNNEHSPMALEIKTVISGPVMHIRLNPWGTYRSHRYKNPISETLKGTMLLGFYPKYVNFHEVEKKLPAGLLKGSLY